VSADKPNPFLSLCAISNPFRELDVSKSHTSHDNPESGSDKASSVPSRPPAVPLSLGAQSSPVADKQPSVTTGDTRQRKLSKVSKCSLKKCSYLVWKIWQSEELIK
jgi:hypothetical protein